jgi:hypothetical protein
MCFEVTHLGKYTPNKFSGWIIRAISKKDEFRDY